MSSKKGWIDEDKARLADLAKWYIEDLIQRLENDDQPPSTCY